LVSWVVAGMITAPSFIAASIASQSASSLPSMTRMRSPRFTPQERKVLATRLDDSESCANDRVTGGAVSLTRCSAGFWLPRAKSSNQSSAQLKSSSFGQRNCA
jgi:hypothetical protein